MSQPTGWPLCVPYPLLSQWAGKAPECETIEDVETCIKSLPLQAQTHFRIAYHESITDGDTYDEAKEAHSRNASNYATDTDFYAVWRYSKALGALGYEITWKNKIY